MHINVFDYLHLAAQPVTEPGPTILLDEHTQLTIQELYQKSLCIGKCLMNLGCHNQPIAVIAAHQAETILLYLGILASGNYYIPLAPDIKPERFHKIRRMSGFQLLLGNENETAFPDLSIPYLSYNKAQDTTLLPADIEQLEACRQKLPAHAPMYLIFTSGSTGEPKGIIKTHENMVNFLDAYIQEFGFEKSDRLGSQTPFYFDASAKDIYLTLRIKCQMHILEEKWFVRPLQLAEYLRDQQITVIHWVPSALSMLSRFRVFDQVSLPNLRMVLFVGEVFPIKQLQIWMESVPHAEYINLYGASELAGICTYYRIKQLSDGQTAIPIGYAMKNCEIFLIDDGRLITDSGQTGELYIKSKAVAAGYLQESGNSKPVFLTRPLPELPEGSYYRSGDLAQYDTDGELIFVSRTDNQIKHMGRRIELGEIESAVQTMEQIRNCCCLFEMQKLILFYEGDCEKADVSRYLKTRLPAYMLPNKLVRLEQWPLNANGKTDRLLLKEKSHRQKRR